MLSPVTAAGPRRFFTVFPYTRAGNLNGMDVYQVIRFVKQYRLTKAPPFFTNKQWKRKGLCKSI